ncbi:acyl carrier protein [Spirillospora sp. NPDC048911]|uniref:acyl carrier protein n=1 Tax=Spirillospora sp. NPDC048911 TaxID=3364527 RepID=UPI003718F624
MSVALDSKVSTIMTTKLGVEASDIQPETTFAELELDSIAVVELIETLEDEFKIEIDDDEASQVSTIADLIALIKSKGASD